jgi:hypothetical protein
MLLKQQQEQQWQNREQMEQYKEIIKMLRQKILAKE